MALEPSESGKSADNEVVQETSALQDEAEEEEPLLVDMVCDTYHVTPQELELEELAQEMAEDEEHKPPKVI